MVRGTVIFGFSIMLDAGILYSNKSYYVYYNVILAYLLHISELSASDEMHGTKKD